MNPIDECKETNTNEEYNQSIESEILPKSNEQTEFQSYDTYSPLSKSSFKD